MAKHSLQQQLNDEGAELNDEGAVQFAGLSKHPLNRKLQKRCAVNLAAIHSVQFKVVQGLASIDQGGFTCLVFTVHMYICTAPLCSRWSKALTKVGSRATCLPYTCTYVPHICTAPLCSRWSKVSQALTKVGSRASCLPYTCTSVPHICAPGGGFTCLMFALNPKTTLFRRGCSKAATAARLALLRCHQLCSTDVLPIIALRELLEASHTRVLFQYPDVHLQCSCTA